MKWDSFDSINLDHCRPSADPILFPILPDDSDHWIMRLFGLHNLKY